MQFLQFCRKTINDVKTVNWNKKKKKNYCNIAFSTNRHVVLHLFFRRKKKRLTGPQAPPEFVLLHMHSFTL